MKFTKLLVIILIISLVLAVGCNKQAAKKETAANNAEPTETASENTETAPAQEPDKEQIQETQTGSADLGISDQELADLKSELNEDVVEDVDTIAFQ